MMDSSFSKDPVSTGPDQLQPLAERYIGRLAQGVAGHGIPDDIVSILQGHHRSFD